MKMATRRSILSEEQGDESYLSDSSLTVVANKSLDMSRSLTERCNKLANMALDEAEELNLTSVPIDEGKELKNNDIVDSKIKMTLMDVENSSTLSPVKKITPHKYNAKEAFRIRVAGEILETERKYCSCLSTLLNHFLGSIKHSNILSSEDLEIMFPSCLEKIYSHHCAFLHRLEYRLASWTFQSILGDILGDFINSVDCDLLNLYQIYVGGFPNALFTIRKASKENSAFDELIKDLQKHPCCDRLDITAFLLTPIQRAPRYVLLLKQLLKYTEPDHPDHAFIENCLAQLGIFLNRLNASIEHSIQIVTLETHDKPKRKFNLSSMSFRSTFGNSEPNSRPTLTRYSYCPKATSQCENASSQSNNTSDLSMSHPNTSTPINFKAPYDVRNQIFFGSDNKILAAKKLKDFKCKLTRHESESVKPRLSFRKRDNSTKTDNFIVENMECHENEGKKPDRVDGLDPNQHLKLETNCVGGLKLNRCNSVPSCEQIESKIVSKNLLDLTICCDKNENALTTTRLSDHASTINIGLTAFCLDSPVRCAEESSTGNSINRTLENGSSSIDEQSDTIATNASHPFVCTAGKNVHRRSSLLSSTDGIGFFTNEKRFKRSAENLAPRELGMSRDLHKRKSFRDSIRSLFSKKSPKAKNSKAKHPMVATSRIISSRACQTLRLDSLTNIPSSSNC